MNAGTAVLAEDLVTVYHGDCRDVMEGRIPDKSVDAIVTDPPYELGFMGKGWDASGIAYNCEVWENAYRVLKPGGHLLAFGGTRTWHRLAVAIEDAGFDVRDNIAYLHDGGLPGPLAWVYASGFPKSLDVSKAIDKRAGAEREVVGSTLTGAAYTRAERRNADAGFESGQVMRNITAPATPAAQQWQGWGTALKPAFEPIVVARKPLDGTVAENVLTHGTGALNIDGSRIESGSDYHDLQVTQGGDHFSIGSDAKTRGTTFQPAAGRWPTNVILDESQAAELDRQSGVTVSRAGGSSGTTFTVNGEGAQNRTDDRGGHNDSGGASRFFYVPKANKRERPRDGDTAHPTVKPLALMRYLVKLVTPPGGTVLEPFAGSGTTAEACVLEGFRCIAIEMTDDYLPLIIQRLERVERGLW